MIRYETDTYIISETCVSAWVTKRRAAVAYWTTVDDKTSVVSYYA